MIQILVKREFKITPNTNQTKSAASTIREREQDIWLGGRGSRLTQSQKKRIKEFCLKRDGEKCMLCKKDVIDPWIDLQIHHKNSKSHLHWASNLELAHASCNSKENNLMYKKTQNNYAGVSVQLQRERKNGVLTHQFTESIASPEVKLNIEYEPYYRKTMFELVKKSRKEEVNLSRKEARVTVRELTGCSQQTSYSYDERLYDSPMSPLMQDTDDCDGALFVRFRDMKDYNLTIEELEAKYPKTGQRFRKEPEMK